MRKLAAICTMIVMCVFAGAQPHAAKQATISKADAQKSALAKVPNGKVKGAELERENGRLVWSFDIAMPGTKDITEVQVDARSGEVVSSKLETAADEKAEKEAERKSRKKP